MQTHTIAKKGVIIMAKFEVGRSYEANEWGYDPIKILKRTDKTVWVDNGQARWKMRVKLDKNGNEFVTDSSVPPSWRFLHTYQARFPAE